MESFFDPHVPETAVITGLAEVVGRKAAAEFAIMRDPDLNPKSVYNLGRIQQRKRDGSCYVTYTDKLFPTSQYSSFGLPVFGSTWFTYDTQTMHQFPSIDVEPSDIKTVELKLTGVGCPKGCNCYRTNIIGLYYR